MIDSERMAVRLVVVPMELLGPCLVEAREEAQEEVRSCHHELLGYSCCTCLEEGPVQVLMVMGQGSSAAAEPLVVRDSVLSAAAKLAVLAEAVNFLAGGTVPALGGCCPAAARSA